MAPLSPAKRAIGDSKKSDLRPEKANFQSNSSDRPPQTQVQQKGTRMTKTGFINLTAAAILSVGLTGAAHAAHAGENQVGLASVYSGGRTANGETAAPSHMTAAHRSLPFGTMVRVTNRSTGRSVVVRINDRGPFVQGRVIDVTPAAAHQLGFSGVTPVALSVLR